MIVSQEMLVECKKRLLQLKQDLLNRNISHRMEFIETDKRSGDEVDQAVAHITEHTLLSNQERLRNQLFEIEFALQRIDSGNYGVCEETQEPIEVERLLAIPYTRLSIEGAELREAFSKKFARS